MFTQNKDITYNENGTCVSKTTYGNGQIVTKYYNKYDKLVKVTSTSGSTETTLLAYLYSDEDVAATVTDPFDTSLKVSESSPLRVEINDGVRTTYTYDNSGQLKQASNDKMDVQITEVDEYGRTQQLLVTENSSVSATNYVYQNNVDDTIKEEHTGTSSTRLYSTTYSTDATSIGNKGSTRHIWT